MTQDDIVKMALEAGYQSVYLSDVPAGRSYKFLERFAALVVAHERENKDKIIDDLTKLLELKTKSEEVAINMIEAAVLAEREACAKVCDSNSKGGPTKYPYCNGLLHGAGICAADIRARGENAG